MKENLLFSNRRGCFTYHSGITFIELLVTLSIICIILPVIFSSFISQNKTYKAELSKYEHKNDSRVVLMELEDSIKNAGCASCVIEQTPAANIYYPGGTLKKLIYIEPIDKKLDAYIIILKLNSRGIKELGRITINPDLTSAHKVKADFWQPEYIKEIPSFIYTSEGVDPSVIESINSSINLSIFSNEFIGLVPIAADDPVIDSITPEIEGAECFYKDSAGRIYVLASQNGRHYKILLKHVIYEHVPYVFSCYNTIMDGIDDVRITTLGNSGFCLEVDSFHLGETYKTQIDINNTGRRVVYD